MNLLDDNGVVIGDGGRDSSGLIRRTQMIRRRRLSTEALETRLVPSTYNLHQGDNLQSTIHAALPGDAILLDAGATFLGAITLEAKANPSKQPITIATNLFPLSAGVRV